MAKFWVYTIGLHDQAPPPEWLVEWGHHRTEMWFPRTKRPASISAGDHAVIYGSQAKGFLAAVVVVGHTPEENRNKEGKERFPFVMRHRLLVAKLADDNVAAPEAADIPSRKIQRGPHTEISEDDYRRAVDVLVDAARRSATS